MTDHSCVIVAIPEDEDRVWDISSEEVPHMTMLYLGDQLTNTEMYGIALYLQHVAENSAQPFYLQVDKRGVLGDNEADVLFFKKEADFKYAQDIRNLLLADETIQKAYLSADQYPEWIPHLTLGYPATPAKTIPDMMVSQKHIYGVSFKKLALWTGQYEGPEFEMNFRHRNYDGEVAMSDKAENFLAHFGVKGMKWGVRKDDRPVNTSTETNVLSKPPVKMLGFTAGAKYREANADTAVTVVHRPGSRLQTSGGSNRSPHEDAIKIAANRRIARSSTTDALSTKDLQEMVNRMNLEQQYNKLTAPQKTTGQKVVDALLGDVATIGRNVAKSNLQGVANEKASQYTLKKGWRQETENEVKRREAAEKKAREQANR